MFLVPPLFLWIGDEYHSRSECERAIGREGMREGNGERNGQENTEETEQQKPTSMKLAVEAVTLSTPGAQGERIETIVNHNVSS